MRKLVSLCGAVALLGFALPAAAVVDPIVLTIDGRNYITITSPVVLSPAEQLLQAPEARLANCRRSNGMAPAFGAARLIYAMNGAAVDAQSLRIEFHPTRIVVDTLYGDMRCDGEANGGESGVDRIFRDLFEPA